MSEKLLKEAAELYKNGECLKAAKLLKQLLQSEQRNTSAWYGLALCLDDPERKQYCLEKILEIDPQHEKARTVLLSLKLAKTTNEMRMVLAPGVEMAFVRIPAKLFLMGSDKTKDQQAYDDELPPMLAGYLDEYWIGKYPVTNLQYRAFVQAEHHSLPGHWKNGDIPQDKEYHPVVFVDWYDAVTFCQWVSKVSGKKIQLASEAEWEKAARGTDERIYPWGNEPPDEKHCNFDQNIDDTTEIGRYSPQGDSPYSCTDMAGNVLEWTRSQYRSYPYNLADGREDLFGGSGLPLEYHKKFLKDSHIRLLDNEMVMRGGSFANISQGLRCACRYSNSPLDMDNYMGFRVVVSSFDAEL